MYEADSVQEKMPEWGDIKYKMPERTGETGANRLENSKNVYRETVQQNENYETEKTENYGETVVLSAGQTEGPASLVSREPGELATIYLDRDLMVIGKMENAADAVISSMVSPFRDRAVRYADICTGVASPLMISFITVSASL